MKRIYYAILMLLCVSFFAACEQEEVYTFIGAPGINFTSQSYTEGQMPNDYTGDPDDPDLMGYVSSYEAHYGKGWYGDKYDTIYIQAKLEGVMQDRPLRVNLKAEPVEGVAFPNMIIGRDSVIQPGKYWLRIRVLVERPAILDSTYQAKFTFDYENSDVVPGSEERQSIILEAHDTYEVNAENMYVSSIEEWNTYYGDVLGPYGPEKARFIYSVFMGRTATLYMYTNYYPTVPDYGFAGNMEQLITALNEYNAAHPDAPVQEADGTLVTFPTPNP